MFTSREHHEMRDRTSTKTNGFMEVERCILNPDEDSFQKIIHLSPDAML
jgi:hypothetical protein